MRQQVYGGRGQRRGALHQRQRVRFARQPRLLELRFGALDLGHDPFGPRQERAHRAGRELPLAVGEENAQVPVMRRADHHPFAEFGMVDAFAGAKLRRVRGHQGIFVRHYLSMQTYSDFNLDH